MDMSGDLKKKVSEWLDYHGGPVELQTARSFQEAGFNISQGIHFVDNLTQKLRECDLLAFMQQVVAPRGCPTFAVATTFLVECKRSKKHPWVAFVVKDQDHFGNQAYSAYHWIMDKLARERIVDLIATQWDKVPTIYNDRPTAYSISQVNLGDKNEAKHDDGSNRAFSAVAQLLDATEARLQRIEEAREPQRCHLLFPVLVFDGQLFEYSLGEAGPTLEETNETTLVLRNRPLGSGMARIKVVTLKGLSDFVSQARSMAEWLCKLADTVQAQLGKS
ncbi:MAG TPA: hypothetical protein VFS30_09155 [Dehalococcoidia bacterium]|nr:hypothetical protein [Dehalococcoidia bacterium]